MFNNREIASAIWLVILSAWLLRQPGIWKSITRLLPAFLKWRMVACILAMTVYVSAIICILWLVGLWVSPMAKDTVLWFLLTGFVMLLKFTTERDSKHLFRSIVRESFKLVIFVEFLIGAYTFPLWAEIFFVPVVTILILLDAVVGTSEKGAGTKRLTGILVAAIGFGILFFAIYRALGDWRNLGTADTFRSFVFAPVMSIAFVPFVYATTLIAAYESLFIRLSIGREKASSVERYARSRIIKHCGLSLKKLRELSSKSFRFHSVETNDDVDEVFNVEPEIAG